MEITALINMQDDLSATHRFFYLPFQEFDNGQGLINFCRSNLGDTNMMAPYVERKWVSSPSGSGVWIRNDVDESLLLHLDSQEIMYLLVKKYDQ